MPLSSSSKVGILSKDAVLVFGSTSAAEPLPIAVPNTGPLAFTVGFRLSVEAEKCVQSVAPPHSHSVSTTFRSTPCGRGGASGASPAAIRSLQSAYIATPLSRPNMFIPELMFGPICPDLTRRFQASAAESNLPSSGSISRVARSPSWWQVCQPLLAWLINPAWLVIVGGLEVAAAGVAGKSLLGGIFKSDNQ